MAFRKKKVKKVRDWTPWLASMAAAGSAFTCASIIPELFIQMEPTPTDEEWDQWLRDILSA